jgi:hypothetical protein
MISDKYSPVACLFAWISFFNKINDLLVGGLYRPLSGRGIQPFHYVPGAKRAGEGVSWAGGPTHRGSEKQRGEGVVMIQILEKPAVLGLWVLTSEACIN